MEERHWVPVVDMNLDGVFSISDVGLWFTWFYFLPGDFLVWFFIKAAPFIGTFFEMNIESYGGVFSGIFSLIIWIGVWLSFTESKEEQEKRLEEEEEELKIKSWKDRLEIILGAIVLIVIIVFVIYEQFIK